MTAIVETLPREDREALVARAQAWVDGLHRAGAYQRVRWTSTVAGSAASRKAGVVLTKVTEAVVRTGVDYANLGVNAGLDTGSLRFGEWLIFPYVIVHTGKDGVTRLYARLNVEDGTARTRYFVDGVEATREAFGEWLTDSQRKPKKPRGGTIAPLLDNVVAL